MRFVESVTEIAARAEAERAAGRRIALVPTMGALHAGHLALVDEARRRADRVWVSIFVNPAQFDSAADLAAYPRPMEADLAACEARGVDLVVAPTAEALYPEGAATWVEVEGLSRPMEGAARPGHFRGVATVVTKLLCLTRPHVAVFGRKDWQQLAVVRRLARDLLLGVEIVGVPTVREADGLALSSRNVHLDGRTRPQARVLSAALAAAEAAVAAGERDARRLLARVRDELAKAPDAEIDYVELADPERLDPAPARLRGPTLLALAVRFPGPAGEGAVRLIDNCVLVPDSDRAPAAADGGGSGGGEGAPEDAP